VSLIESVGWVVLGALLAGLLVGLCLAAWWAYLWLWTSVVRYLCAWDDPVDAHAATVPTDEPRSTCLCPPPGCGGTPCKTYTERHAHQ
jgi:hypothetical protein